MIGEDADLGFAELVAVFKGQTGYAMPKSDVRAAAFEEGRLLMLRESLDRGWALPGRWADVDDDSSAPAEREVWE